MIRYYIIVEGRVQGVGFRYLCQLTATSYNLTGWVRNMDNGMVEMQIQGEENNINKFINTIKIGNRFVKIDEIYKKKIDIIEYEKNFNIKY